MRGVALAQREHVPHGGIAGGLCAPLEKAQAHSAENTSVGTTLELRRPWAPWCVMIMATRRPRRGARVLTAITRVAKATVLLGVGG